MENLETLEYDDSDLLMELTSEVVCAYIGNNQLAAADISGLIKDVHSTLGSLSDNSASKIQEKLTPAVSIKKSLGHEYLICLEDGKSFKSLKRHLRTHYDLSPEEYRNKWGLPANYPMVAPAYAEERSRLAKEMGLGRKSKAS